MQPITIVKRQILMKLLDTATPDEVSKLLHQSMLPFVVVVLVSFGHLSGRRGCRLHSSCMDWAAIQAICKSCPLNCCRPLRMFEPCPCLLQGGGGNTSFAGHLGGTAPLPAPMTLNACHESMCMPCKTCCAITVSLPRVLKQPGSSSHDQC